MDARKFEPLLVFASWALVAMPAWMLFSGELHRIERWLLAATALPLLGLLARYVAVARALRRRNRSLAEDVLRMEQAEELAETGRWSIDVAERTHKWSDEMCEITGLSAGTAPDDAAIAALFPHGLGQLEATTYAHRHDREAFAVEFEICKPDEGPRILRARARNAFSPEGVREHIFMVVRDITDDYSKVAAIAEERKEAIAEANRQRQLASTDALTGLANRRHAMGELDRMIVAARSSGSQLSVVLFDLDHFKTINDTHGHAVGDDVLKQVALIASQQVRGSQVVARIGGEEFLCILPGAGSRAAAGMAERLRLAIQAGTALAPVPAVTASVGQATLEGHEPSLALFARADGALYAAKRAGRNRVALAA